MSDDAQGVWHEGVRQRCFCGEWLPGNGELHPRCRAILKDGLRKVYMDTLKSVPVKCQKKTSSAR